MNGVRASALVFFIRRMQLGGENNQTPIFCCKTVHVDMTCAGDVAEVDVDGVPLHVAGQAGGLNGGVVEGPLHVQVGVDPQHVQPVGAGQVVQAAGDRGGAGRFQRESNRGEVKDSPPVHDG